MYNIGLVGGVHITLQQLQEAAQQRYFRVYQPASLTPQQPPTQTILSVDILFSTESPSSLPIPLLLLLIFPSTSLV